jgi:hypothetical protein
MSPEVLETQMTRDRASTITGQTHDVLNRLEKVDAHLAQLRKRFEAESGQQARRLPLPVRDLVDYKLEEHYYEMEKKNQIKSRKQLLDVLDREIAEVSRQIALQDKSAARPVAAANNVPPKAQPEPEPREAKVHNDMLQMVVDAQGNKPAQASPPQRPKAEAKERKMPPPAVRFARNENARRPKMTLPIQLDPPADRRVAFYARTLREEAGLDAQKALDVADLLTEEAIAVKQFLRRHGPAAADFDAWRRRQQAETDAAVQKLLLPDALLRYQQWRKEQTAREYRG